MNNQPQIFRSCTGLSLIEIMIAMVLGLLLLGGTVTIFSSNKRIYKEQEEMGRLQENARFALDSLIKDLRMADYKGCKYDDAMPVGAPIAGVNGGGTVPDQITIRFIGGSVLANYPGTNPFTIDEPHSFHDGDTLAIASCLGVETHDISDIQFDTPAGESTVTLATTPTLEVGEIHRFNTRTYSINGNILERDGEPFIDGVENLQILYGEDTSPPDPATERKDRIADAYVAADGVTNWADVVSVRVALLFRTLNDNPNNELDTRSYNLLGSNYNPADDRRRRQRYFTTVQIRNKINQ